MSKNFVSIFLNPDNDKFTIFKIYVYTKVGIKIECIESSANELSS